MKPRTTRSDIRVERRHGRGDARAAMMRLLAVRSGNRGNQSLVLKKPRETKAPGYDLTSARLDRNSHANDACCSASDKAPAPMPAAIVSTGGLLARNISQLIWHGKGKFHEDLWG